MMYVFIGLLAFFGVVMIALLITLELYAEFCVRNNEKVVWHMEWLRCTGMKETQKLIHRRWMWKI
ncbi:hypothetical protein LCGC14_2129650 [marine sediment metagenome]|uniref:Uncharacterized protein n=1 Tax=marine sediment metagenome TaxID=412755 RepID=A0A0F9E1W4_9ZZZZ